MEFIILALVMNLTLTTVDWKHRPRGGKALTTMQMTHP